MADISKQITKLKELIGKSSKILITSHISPDPDAFSSMLLFGTTLEENFPDKTILMSSEEMPEGLEFLEGYQKIKQQSLMDALDGVDLIILVDTMNFGRASRKQWQEVTTKVKSTGVPLVIIDHHEAVGVEGNDVYINRKYPAAVEEVYEVLFNDLSLKKPNGWAQTTMTGLYSDTGSFTYLNEKYEETLDLIKELVRAGVKVEQIRTKLNQYSLDHIAVLNELLANMKNQADYTYSFIGDEFLKRWLSESKTFNNIQFGARIFTDQYLRSIEGHPWGFTVYPDPLTGEDCYSVSFRSVNGYVDVAALASEIHGGGHKSAAGGKVRASSVQEVCDKIIKIISETRA